ncbi:hypothetical protein EVAR_57700_1 [Eumeta japonica]|uniref:Uncharacterized protein n=1 Tax=Eumeta variegata TaxID=151549 RepID=A0A4C1Y602_EUMVA|nr:hypothetical protein EVAR_57700_1 [Eumeta japonica]
MRIRTVMTYASPVFAHAAPKPLDRNLELPTISKYMKDVSKRFFDIAGSYSNALLRAAVDYEPPPTTHFIRRPRNVLNDPPVALTAARPRGSHSLVYAVRPAWRERVVANSRSRLRAPDALTCFRALDMLLRFLFFCPVGSVEPAGRAFSRARLAGVPVRGSTQAV